MRFGLLTLGDALIDPVTGHRHTPASKHRSLVEQGVLAERAGFDAVHLGEHHFSGYILSAPAIALAAIAERTTTLRLSTGVALAANLDPVRIAEDYATVDALSGGRVEPCFGRGTLFPDVYTGFGQNEATAGDRFAETVELVMRLWREEGVTWKGMFRTPLIDVTVQPRPTQLPNPPVWIGAGLSPASVDLAARLGCRLMLPSVFGTWELFRPIVERYRTKWEQYGHDAADIRIGCCSHCFVGRDSAATLARWKPRYMHYMESVVEWGRQSAIRAGRPDARGFPVSDFETLVSTIAICGSPAEVVDRIGTANEILGTDTHLLKLDLGGVPDGEVFDAIELLGADVLPHFTGTSH